ncbi:MAG: hypothetical protein OEY38_17030, partial [Gammaproteobacteria bacterium]|nr:hypothetical protein [Gammaproteobacteria bacterium]
AYIGFAIGKKKNLLYEIQTSFRTDLYTEELNDTQTCKQTSELVFTSSIGVRRYFHENNLVWYYNPLFFVAPTYNKIEEFDNAGCDGAVGQEFKNNSYIYGLGMRIGSEYFIDDAISLIGTFGFRLSMSNQTDPGRKTRMLHSNTSTTIGIAYYWGGKAKGDILFE